MEIERGQNNFFKRTKLEDLYYLILRLFTKLQLSRQCGISIRINNSMEQNREARNKPIYI